MLKYQVTIGVLCFVLGVAVVLLIQNHKETKGRNVGVGSELFSQKGGAGSTLDSLFNDDFFRSGKSHFEEIKRMQERMMKSFDSSSDGPRAGIFHSWFKKKFCGGDSGDIR